MSFGNPGPAGEVKRPSQSAANRGPFAGSPQEESLGRLCYEAFCQATLEWLPDPPDFKRLSIEVQRGWIAGAKKVINAFLAA